VLEVLLIYDTNIKGITVPNCERIFIFIQNINKNKFDPIAKIFKKSISSLFSHELANEKDLK
jgi:hypothetical protein